LSKFEEEDVHTRKTISALSAVYKQSAAAAARASFILTKKSSSHKLKPSGYHCTPEGLIEAMKDGYIPAARTMLLKNPNLCQARLPKTEETVLKYAVRLKMHEIVLALLAAGADPCAVGLDGVSAMDIAPPSLKRRMIAVCLMALKTHTTAHEAEAADAKAEFEQQQQKKLMRQLSVKREKKEKKLSPKASNNSIVGNGEEGVTVVADEDDNYDDEDDEDYEDYEGDDVEDGSPTKLSRRGSLSNITPTGLSGHVAER
jgi:hypothetical protein